MAKIGIFFAEKCEEIEGLAVVDIVRRAKMDITSISITECCRQIYWDLPLNSDDFEQSIERPRGPMQKETVETNILLFSKSVDIYTWFEILCKKSNVRKAILEKDTLSTQDLKKILNPDKRYYVDGVEV